MDTAAFARKEGFLKRKKDPFEAYWTEKVGSCGIIQFLIQLQN